MDKQRLQELAGINVNELNINKPMSKTEIIKQIGEFDSSFFEYLIQSKDINTFITSLGYETLRDALTDNWGYEEGIEKAANLIEKYYQYIQFGETSIIDNNVIKNDIHGFKNLWNYSDDEKDIIFVTKF
jgi:hypothetical protein